MVEKSAEYTGYIVWQLPSENPYPRNNLLNQEERLIIHDRDPNRDPRFSTDPATQGIDELYFQFSGYIQPVPKSALEFEPLVNTGTAGRILVYDFVYAPSKADQVNKRGAPNREFTIAAHIFGDKKDDPPPANATELEKSKLRTNVIYVADIDTLADYFVQIRDFPIEDGVEYRFQNMSFVLNIIDALAGEDAYLGLRNRKVDHVTLEVVEKTYDDCMQRVYELDQQLQIDYETNLLGAQNEIRQKTASLEDSIRKELKKKDAKQPYDAVKLKAQQGLLEQEIREQSAKFQSKQVEFENERREKKRKIDLDAELEIQEIQRKFKLAAVVIPPIPPLLVGLVVFTRRRLREREGISKARRLK
jgi:ABC-2 type transport system permease protein